MTYRALLFAAVSTEAQATEDRASLDTQLEQCRAVCTARGWHVVAELRVEGHSRNYDWLHEIIRDCPAYGDLIRQIEAETADLVVVRDYDRLWRTDALRAQVTALCRQHHVQVFSCNQPVEPVASALLADSDTARLSEVLYGFISEQEGRTRNRRRKVGMEQGRVLRRGLHHASRGLYGYQHNPLPGQPMTPVEPQASHVRFIFERRAEGWSYERIGAALDERGILSPRGARWHTGPLYYLLHNAVYVGQAHWGDAHTDAGAHVPLVDPELWARVQAVNANRSVVLIGIRGPRLLTGLTKCGHCGWGECYAWRRGGYYVLSCNRHSTDRTQCYPNSWRALDVERQVLAEVKAALADPDAWQAARRAASGNGHNAERVAALDKHLADARARYKRWDALYETGGISANELLLHRQEITGQVEATERERAGLLETQRSLELGRARLLELGAVLPKMDGMPLEELRTLLRAVIARVRLYQVPARHIEVDWL